MIGAFEEQPSNLPHGGLPANVVSTSFPMLQTHFPRWSRVGRLDRRLYPKPVKQDRISAPPSSMARRSSGQSAKKSKSQLESQNALGKSSNNSECSDVSWRLNEVALSQRVIVLEKNIKFLKEKHLEMLSALHQELEKLKQQNKELQFQLVMNGCLKCSTCIQGKDITLEEPQVVIVQNCDEHKVPPETDNLADNQRISFLEEEIQELRQALHDARTRNYYLANLLEQANQKQEVLPCNNNKAASNLSFFDLKPTTGPLMVYPKDEAPRPPTIQECEVIIKHLQEINEQQDVELCRLKTNVLQCSKNHLNQFDYVERKMRHPQPTTIKLPKIFHKPSTKKGCELKPSPKEKLTLPVLKDPVHPTRLTERRSSRPPLIPNTQTKNDS